MSELTDQIQELSDNFDQFSTDAQSSLDDHSQTLDDHTQTLSDLDQRTGQLDFPLSPDSVQRIKEIFPTGTAVLNLGTVTVKDPNILASSIIIYNTQTSSTGGLAAGYSYTVSDGQVIFTSTVNTDSSTLVYVIF